MNSEQPYFWLKKSPCIKFCFVKIAQDLYKLILIKTFFLSAFISTKIDSSALVSSSSAKTPINTLVSYHKTSLVC